MKREYEKSRSMPVRYAPAGTLTREEYMRLSSNGSNPEPLPPTETDQPPEITPPLYDKDYMKKGNCLGSDNSLFFPSQGEDYRDAIQVCSDCPVRVDCLAAALENDEKYGIWGGKSEKQRRQLRRTIRLGKLTIEQASRQP